MGMRLFGEGNQPAKLRGVQRNFLTTSGQVDRTGWGNGHRREGDGGCGHTIDHSGRFNWYLSGYGAIVIHRDGNGSGCWRCDVTQCQGGSQGDRCVDQCIHSGSWQGEGASTNAVSLSHNITVQQSGCIDWAGYLEVARTWQHNAFHCFGGVGGCDFEVGNSFGVCSGVQVQRTVGGNGWNRC